MPARKKAASKAKAAKTTKRATTKATGTSAKKATTRTTTTARAKAKSTTRVTAKATTVKTVKATAKPKANKISSLSTKAITQKMTKSQIYKEIAEVTNLNKVDVQNVLVALRNIVERNVKPRAVGKFKIPELDIQVTLKQKKASKARTGRNPFTGEEIQIAAKPARKVIKVSALKSLKELVV
jgi:nucleoid DNA-binding protein